MLTFVVKRNGCVNSNLFLFVMSFLFCPLHVHDALPPSRLSTHTSITTRYVFFLSLSISSCVPCVVMVDDVGFVWLVDDTDHGGHGCVDTTNDFRYLII